MVDLTRRKAVIGLGLLATGSGATFTSASFENAVASDSDLRVVVQQQGLEFEGNSADSPDPKAVDNPDFFEDDPSGGLNETDGSAFEDGFGETPTGLAFAEGSNENLTVKTAVPLDDLVTFEELFEISNNSTEDVIIGVAYDRKNSDFDFDGDNTGQYGTDVDVDGGSGVLNAEDAQAIYQFQAAPPGQNSSPTTIDPSDGSETNVTGGEILSPASGSTGLEGAGSEGTTIVDEDLPENAFKIPSGDTLLVDLQVDTQDDGDGSLGDEIEAEADIDQSALGLQTDTVQIIDGITIVSFGDDSDVTDPTA